uniref:EF-hand domain-containing protein n=1 Tax=Alexandrium catenella TaxID=2925 RepID=A0A7S1LGS1_ALECA|mmetsp:Transcript_112997/g.300182  ORF Transcript_112997/g.300182 Transcript_112997/m.300182 type:complete len:387 (+) Transcript_112997:2-1162(+)
MRLHRDGECQRLRLIFDRFAKGQEGQAYLSGEDVQLALTAHLQAEHRNIQWSAATKARAQDMVGNLKLEPGSELAGGDSSAPLVQVILSREGTPSCLNFEAFVALAESHRSATVVRQRRFAGFPKETVMQVKELFKKWDADSSGVIDPHEIEGLLKELGMECRTVEEQRSLIAVLDQARAAAIDAGVELQCRPGEGSVCFWVLVQLMRILRNEKLQGAEVREVQVIKELSFSKAEVEDFREVFVRWTRHGRVGSEDLAEGSMSPGGISFAARAGAAGGGAIEEGLSRGTFYKLLLSLGIPLGMKEREELEVRFALADLNNEGRLSFIGFLGLMRWLLDSDFAGINAAAEETVATIPSEGNFFQRRRHQSMLAFHQLAAEMPMEGPH